MRILMCFFFFLSFSFQRKHIFEPSRDEKNLTHVHHATLLTFLSAHTEKENSFTEENEL